MDDVKSIISKNTNKDNFNKQEWIKHKNEERKKVYKEIDDTVSEVMKNKDAFRNYLNIQGKFDMYSVANALLISKYKPEATILKDYEGWKEMGVNTKGKDKSIKILEPTENFLKGDSSKTRWNVKYLYDVKDTTMNRKISKVEYDIQVKLTALLENSPVDPQVDNDKVTKENSVAQWNEQDNVIYIKNGENLETTFKDISRELALARFESDKPELTNFRSNCVSYLVCTKYGIDTSDIDITIPEDLSRLSNKDFRSELANIRAVAGEMNERINLNINDKMRKNDEKQVSQNRSYER